MGIIKEFNEFLREYKVLPLAIAFIMGAAITSVVNSLAKDIIMPMVTPFISGGEWETATLSIGSAVLKWGSFLSELVNFIVIAFVIFLIAKTVLKEKKVTKK